MHPGGPSRPWCRRTVRAPARPDAVLQRRGIERMHAILDTAETIMIEEGYEGATLKAVSDRTGIPAASVYHYFLDRHQVDTALMLRHLGALDEQLVASLGRIGGHRGIREVVDALIDPVLRYLRDHPVCVELRFGQSASGQNELVRAFDEATAGRSHRLAIQRGLLRPDTPPLVMRLAFEIGDRLFDVAFRRAPGVGDDETLDQARLIITRYLHAHEPEGIPS